MRFFISQKKASVRIRDKLERTILHYSSLSIEISLVKFFLAGGADQLNTLDANGYTALHFACFEGKPDFVRFLLDKGADFRIRVGSWTPLHLVILSSLTGHQKTYCVEIAYMLIEKGVDKSCKDQDGRTAFDMAVILEEEDLLRVFHFGSDEGVSEIVYEPAVVDGEDISPEINEDVGESTDEDGGENTDEDVYEGSDEDVGASINQDIGALTHEDAGALTDEDADEITDEDADESTDEQLVAVVDGWGDESINESMDGLEVIIEENITLGRDEVVSETADEQVTIVGVDKMKLLEAANEIFAHIRKYRNKEDIDVV